MIKCKQGYPENPGKKTKKIKKTLETATMLIKTKFKSKKPWREFQRQNSSKQSMVKPPLMTSLMTSMDSWVPVLQRSKKMKPKVRTSETRQQSEGRSS